MIRLYEPKLQDLWFRQQLLADEATMSYNHAWGGTIPFPETDWKAWYDHWVTGCESRRFYRYLLEDESGSFVGEIAYHHDAEREIWLADVIVSAKYRGRGYGTAGLELLCEAAAKAGIGTLRDDIAIDNPAVGLFLKAGFTEEYRTDRIIMLKKDLQKVLEIVGDNYFGKWDKVRTACRAIIAKEGRVLLSYETLTDQWMLPGGGLENGESEEECCVREVGEETGLLIRPSACLFRFNEYYEDCRYVSSYFTGEIVGSTERRLTKREREVGMEPRWLPLSEAVGIFSRHADYTDTDEERRGIYLREYTALCEFLRMQAGQEKGGGT